MGVGLLEAVAGIVAGARRRVEGVPARPAASRQCPGLHVAGFNLVDRWQLGQWSSLNGRILAGDGKGAKARPPHWMYEAY